MIVADIMTRTPIAISRDAPLSLAIQLMTDHRISGLPVIDNEMHVVGMLTEGDLLRRAEIGTQGDTPGWFASFFAAGRLAENYVRTHGRLVCELMTSDAILATEDMPVVDVVRLMRRNRIKRLPVVLDGRLIGIVSRADLLRVIGATLQRPQTAVDDVTIHQSILDAMKRERWLDRSVSIAVDDGKVRLDGHVFDVRQRDAIGVIAANALGVKAVVNRLVCIDPRSGLTVFDPNDAGDTTESQNRLPKAPEVLPLEEPCPPTAHLGGDSV